jgi:hypothetical protein
LSSMHKKIVTKPKIFGIRVKKARESDPDSQFEPCYSHEQSIFELTPQLPGVA